MNSFDGAELQQDLVVPEWASGRPSTVPNQVRPNAALSHRTQMVCIGGGTGLPMLLKGLARRAAPKVGDAGLDLTAVVAMSDDGGSSGRLRRARGILPPGDIRNCLAALAEGSPLMDVFQHRFEGEGGLGGHALGNLLIAALTEKHGNFMEAVQATGKLLGARGRVLPSTLQPVELAAEFEDETRVLGERKISRIHKRVRRVSLEPTRPEPVPGLIESIRAAELIVFGPGSLYSSIMPNLLVGGVAEALHASRAMKVMVANLMTQPGETDGMSCEDHVKAVIDHVGPVVDVVLLNGTKPSDESMARYANQGSKPIFHDPRAMLQLGVIPVQADLLKSGTRIRHDSNKVARCLIKLARCGL